jgi:hypothetical protein
MSEPVDPSLPEVSEALAANGQDEFEEVSGDRGYDFGEESDEYDDDIDDEEVQRRLFMLEYQLKSF